MKNTKVFLRLILLCCCCLLMLAACKPRATAVEEAKGIAAATDVSCPSYIKTRTRTDTKDITSISATIDSDGTINISNGKSCINAIPAGAVRMWFVAPYDDGKFFVDSPSSVDMDADKDFSIIEGDATASSKLNLTLNPSPGTPSIIQVGDIDIRDNIMTLVANILNEKSKTNSLVNPYVPKNYILIKTYIDPTTFDVMLDIKQGQFTGNSYKNLPDCSGTGIPDSICGQSE